MPFFLRSPYLLVFTAVIVVQGLLGYYVNARSEYVPPTQPLETVPKMLGPWRMLKDWPMEPEVQAVLKANDTLTRDYGHDGKMIAANLFIAFFKTQRNGVAPHSPKNCLPGNGWVSEENRIIQVPISGRAEPIEVSYYLIQRGDNKSVVIYWYQSHGRVVASEYRAKFYVVADAIRMNRTDTSLVKVTLPVGRGGVEEASNTAISFVQELFVPVSQVLPN